MFKIIARKFSPIEFREYLKTVGEQPWVKKIVLHNTYMPALKDRVGGILTPQHIKNLHNYYANTKSWSGGPHLFIDANGIWVFNPLNDPGVHSPSYNKSAWGVEMLGNYETESFTSGLGAEVALLTFEALRALRELQGWSNLTNENFLLHREDKQTTHACPGKNVVKSEVMKMVNQTPAAATLNAFMLTVDEVPIPGAFIKEGVAYAPVRKLADALGFEVNFNAGSNRANLTIRKTEN